jgi:NAD(P)-dependent dehydrogenase (short-subunit alcohol dehydrogenase family)
MGQLDGKVAVITGGASGIGAGTCRLFVEQGARVVVSDILDAEGKNLVAQLGAAAVYVHTDVTREADLAAAVATATERFGRLDCVFNNAGAAGIDAPIADTDAEGLQRTVALLFTDLVDSTPLLQRASDDRGIAFGNTAERS